MLCYCSLGKYDLRSRVELRDLTLIFWIEKFGSGVGVGSVLNAIPHCK